MQIKEIRLPFKVKRPVLALGTHTKNTVCFASGNSAYLSGTHQDLSDPEDFISFQESVKYFLKNKPRIIAYDLHSGYQSSRYASALAKTRKLAAVQHHHAHIASCMVENGLKNQDVIGIAFDGTGLGMDGKLWGAEFFAPCSYRGFKRKAHLKEVPLLGGDRAILEPWRVAAIWLYLAHKDRFLDLNIPFVKSLDRKKWLVLKRMYIMGFNSPLISSMGRLFDAVGSLILARFEVRGEAELPKALENMAEGYPAVSECAHTEKEKGYSFYISSVKGVYLVDPAPLFKQIVSELEERNSREGIAYYFHQAVAEMVRKVSLCLREKSGIGRVVLSGGVFQNNLLLRLSLELLYKEGFEVFTHRNLSSGDSCISLGQAAVAGFGG